MLAPHEKDWSSILLWYSESWASPSIPSSSRNAKMSAPFECLQKSKLVEFRFNLYFSELCLLVAGSQTGFKLS